ncbi:MAG TPA: protein kinase [Blastocatellia bacterium]|nr:protein kinase [Blastocatellia bacterium]
MTPERYKEVGEIYRAAVEVDADRLAAFLAEACRADDELRREVESLLGFRECGGIVDRGALEVVARALADDPTTAFFNRNAGHYRLLSLLGKGGMGEVYLGLDTRLNRQVAIKLLPAGFTQDADRVRRFEQEARAASALNHPNIITVYEIGEAPAEGGTVHYIVTEYVEGQTLRQLMTSAPHNRMRIAEAVDIAAQLAAALTAAHEAGIAHRDIKPENVMVRRDGYVKVLDFGLAKLTEPSSPAVDPQTPAAAGVSTEAGVVMGTPRYMSPEQARGEKVDTRTDIFSLGVTLYEMIAGRRPFEGATTSDVIAALLIAEPPPLWQSCPEVPAEMERLVGKCLAKDCEARYQSAKELIAELKRLPTDNQAQVAETKARGDSATERDATLDRRQPSFGKLKRHKLGAALALLLAAVATAVYFNPFGGSGQAPAEIDSLAVLPFVNVGANPDAEYLSDGITDSLINVLAQLPKLKVMSRSAVFRHKGKETDAQQAGTALGVRAVLTGKVTQRGDDLIVSVELVDVRDNSHLWGAQYHHKLSDLLAVQAELSRDIAGKLRLRLGSAEQQRLTKRGTENAEAYELYLKGRYYHHTLQREEEKKAIDYYQRAIEKDPRFVLPYAGLASLYVAIASIGATFTIPPREAFQKAKEAASKAVELDDTLAEAHLSQARIAEAFDWDWNVAEREFNRAIELNPNLVEARHIYAHLLVSRGRFEEALAESLRALAPDPLDVGMNFHLGWYYYNTRQYEQAVAQLQKTLGLNQRHSGAHSILGLSYARQRRYPEAIAEVQKGIGLGGRDIRGHLGHIYALAGRRGEAQKLIAQLREEAKHKPVSPFNIARIYVGLGEKDQALAWLEKAIAERDSNINEPGLKVDETFDSLRSDPRFTNLLQRIGLSP